MGGTTSQIGERRIVNQRAFLLQGRETCDSVRDLGVALSPRQKWPRWRAATGASKGTPPHMAGGASKICRTSVSPSQPFQCSLWSAMKRVVHRIASSLDGTSKTA
jgi:hypothetical protein